MKPAAFDYFAPEKLDELLVLKRQYGDDARFIAGGQSLVPAMNFRLAMPAVLLDLNRISNLNYQRFDKTDSLLKLGALTRHAALLENPLIAQVQPLLSSAIAQVAHPQIRNRGTVCGNLAHADPASELPAVMLALGARMRLQSSRGERWIEAQDFFVALYTTALRADELLIEIEIPVLAPHSGTSFLEIARRPGDFALVGTAIVLSLDRGRRCSHVKLAYCGVGSTAILSTGAAEVLVGNVLSDEVIAAAAARVVDDIEPMGNIHASADYQRHLASVLTRRGLAQALAQIENT